MCNMLGNLSSGYTNPGVDSMTQDIDTFIRKDLHPNTDMVAMGVFVHICLRKSFRKVDVAEQVYAATSLSKQYLIRS